MNQRLFVCAMSLLLYAGCLGPTGGIYREDAVTESGQPGYVTVQHCLIGFENSVQNVVRSKEEAEQLAGELLEKANSGADFDQLVRDYTDDSPPGLYKIANTGMDSDMNNIVPTKRIWDRNKLVPAFGDVGFSLEVGEIAMAAYDKEKSPFGWHIIKRIR